MTENILDIVQIIEKNPLSRLSSDYQNKLLNKIKDKFSQKEQQLFVSSFYCYLNYNSKNDFIIDLNDIWKWIGFSRKDPAKRLLEKFFVIDIDYKIFLHSSVENSKGGRPIEKILMNINTFKKFCLKAGTKKADEIHDYYIKLEEILHDTINEETNELRNQILLKDKEIIDICNNNKLQDKLNKHKLLLEKFKNKRCVYVAEIEENKFIKIGSTKDIADRYNSLKRTYVNIIFLDIYECQDFRDVESSILKNEEVVKNIYDKPINKHLSHEVVLLTEKFNYNQLFNIVKKCVIHNFFLTPEQILERDKIDLERQKIEFEKYKLNNSLLLNIINNDLYKDNVKNILNEQLPEILYNLSQQLNNTQTNLQTNIKDDKSMNEKIVKNDETQNPNYNMLCHFEIKGRKPKGRKIQKIDPNNLHLWRFTPFNI